MKFIANENFPLPSFNYLLSNSIDIRHIGIDFPGISFDSKITVIDKNSIRQKSYV